MASTSATAARGAQASSHGDGRGATFLFALATPFGGDSPWDPTAATPDRRPADGRAAVP